MYQTLSLGESEQRVADEVLARYWRNRTPPVTLYDLVMQWAHTVANITLGYHLEFDDYKNDLHWRSILQDVADAIGDSRTSTLAEVLEIWDKRFMAVTRPVDQPIWKPREWEHHFWYWRIPRKLPPSLRETMEAQGILPRDASKPIARTGRRPPPTTI